MSEIKKNNWKILELVDWSTQYLKEKGFEDARLNVELLLCQSLNCSRIDLYKNFDKPLKGEETSKFKQLFRRRLNHEPLQYILGETEFMGLKFSVDSRVLIPRQDTETLVEEVIKQFKNNNNVIKILDIGAGSGNISISLAKFLPHATVTSIDKSDDALVIARRNAERNSVFNRIGFFQKDIFDEISFDEKFDAVVSNPPYISNEEFLQLSREVSEYEPRIATTDFDNGLTFFERIADISRRFLKTGGYLFLEIAYNQSVPVSQILKNHGYSCIETIKDFSGNDRVIKGKI